jgi:hypothetical protein
MKLALHPIQLADQSARALIQYVRLDAGAAIAGVAVVSLFVFATIPLSSSRTTLDLIL